MKNLFNSKFLLIAFTAVLISCENESFNPDEASLEVTPNELSKKFIDSLSDTFTTNLMAGQHHNAGTVSVTKDANNLLVTYATNTDTSSTKRWAIKATHLYVGACDAIPTTKAGNPKIGRFPYKQDHEAGTTSYTYTIPLDMLDDCFCVAAHAVVDCHATTITTPTIPTIPTVDPTIGSKPGKGKDKDGDKDQTDDTCGEETAWAEGQEFPGNSWAMFIEICKPSDPVPTPNPSPIIPSNPTWPTEGS